MSDEAKVYEVELNVACGALLRVTASDELEAGRVASDVVMLSDLEIIETEVAAVVEISA